MRAGATAIHPEKTQTKHTVEYAVNLVLLLDGVTSRSPALLVFANAAKGYGPGLDPINGIGSIDDPTYCQNGSSSIQLQLNWELGSERARLSDLISWAWAAAGWWFQRGGARWGGDCWFGQEKPGAPSLFLETKKKKHDAVLAGEYLMASGDVTHDCPTHQL